MYTTSIDLKILFDDFVRRRKKMYVVLFLIKISVYLDEICPFFKAFYLFI